MVGHWCQAWKLDKRRSENAIETTTSYGPHKSFIKSLSWREALTPLSPPKGIRR